MAFPHFASLTQASSGATRNSGTNGDLNALLNWALPQANWTRTFNNSGTNESVFSSPSGGLFLYVRHDSGASGNAGLAVIRGAEGSTSYTEASLTNPYPLVSQIADTSSNWIISSAASTTSRNFRIVVWDSGVVYFSQFSGSSDVYDVGFLIAGKPRFSADPYLGVCCIRNITSAVGPSALSQTTSSVPFNSGFVFCQRDITGSVLSSRASFKTTGGQLSVVSTTPAARAGYGNNVEREKVLISDFGSASSSVGTTLIGRFMLPQLWSLLHANGSGVSDTDVCTDSAYDPTASFTIYKSSAATAGILLETTNTAQSYPAG